MSDSGRKLSSPDLDVRRVSIDDVHPDPANARKHGQKNLDAIRGSIRQFGQVEPLVVQRSTGKVIGGNGRLEVMRSMGFESIDIVEVDVDDTQAASLGLALNRTGELAEWDLDALDAITKTLDTGSLGDIGFNAGDLDELLIDIRNTPDPGAASDEIPEPPANPVTKPGDLWVMGDHRLLCGDCRDIDDMRRLVDGEKVNVAFTSPPYASQRKYDESSGFKPIHPDTFVEWFEPVQANVRDVLAADGSWFVNITEAATDGQKHPYVKRLTLEHIDEWDWLWIDEFCWPRPAMPLNPNNSRRFKNGWESVFHFAKSKTFKFLPDAVRHASDGVFRYSEQKAAGKMISGNAQGVGGGITSPVGSRRGLAYPSNLLSNMGGAKIVGHSAAFPVCLPSFFIKAYSGKGDCVLDPFMGSGTTIIAAEQNDRRCTGLEISPAYCDLIVERWENATGGKATRG